MNKLELSEKLQKVRLLVSDFDGVMTDGYVYVNEKGEETVRCSRKDGMGLSMLKKAGISVVVISKEVNQVVMARCKKLEIPCYHGIEDGKGKLEILKKLLAAEKLHPWEVAYVGDDLNDKQSLEYVEIAICVNDAHPEIKKLCDYITSANGGAHAIREVCEMLLAAKNIHPAH